MTIPNGLKVLPKDERDLKLGAVITLPALSELPLSYRLPKTTIKSQIDDFCSGTACTAILETTEGKELDELWYFAKSKEISGDVDEFGQDLRTAMKTAVKFGAISKAVAPFTKDKGSDFLRRIENYSKDLEWKAGEHKQKSYFFITGKYDAFDNARASLWAFRDLKRGAIMGLEFGWPLSQTYLLGTPSGYGHAMKVDGFETVNGENWIVLQQSYGTQAGKDGYQWISRETFNAYADTYGVGMFIDLPADEAKFHNKWKIPLKYNWIAKIVFSFRDLLGMGSAR